MLRELLKYVAILIPVILIANAFWATAKRKKGKNDSAHGNIGLALFLIWLVCVVSYFAGVGTPDTIASETISDNPSSWSLSTTQSATDRVIKWEKQGLLKVEISGQNAYVSPVLWNMIDVNEKKELMISVIIYADSNTDHKHTGFDFYNLQTGKQVASWDNISDFNFQY